MFLQLLELRFYGPCKKTLKITPVKKSTMAARGRVLGVKRCVEVLQPFTDVVEKQFYLPTVAFKGSAECRSCSVATPTIGSQTLWLEKKQTATFSASFI